jgi:hypothetical protein
MNLRSHSLDKLRQIITTGALGSATFLCAARAAVSFCTTRRLPARPLRLRPLSFTVACLPPAVRMAAPRSFRSGLLLVGAATAATAAAAAAAVATAPLPVIGGTARCGRMYEGIGGLLNSDAPWLRAYPEPQRSQVLDVLFRPQYAGSLQVLKLEVGGDGHSTINTESSHMHTEHEQPSFRRGWVTWLLQEAVRRNPDIKVGGLAWTWPGWTKGSVSKKVGYLVQWVQGIKANFNVTVSFMGLQNEGQVRLCCCLCLSRRRGKLR